MKPILYFIPGTMCDERLWEEVWPLLQPSYHCVHLEIPMAYSIDAIIASLSEVLPTSGVNLIGFSLGGYLASQFACQYTHRLSTLTVIANAPTALPSHEIVRREGVIRWVERQGYDGVSDRVINEQLHTKHKNNHHIINKVKAMDATLGEQVLLQQLKATSNRRDLFSLLNDIPIPKLFCSGEEDNLVSATQFNHFSGPNNELCVDNRLKQSGEKHIEFSGAQHLMHKYVQLDNCGHMMPLEQPVILAKLILNWLHKQEK